VARACQAIFAAANVGTTAYVSLFIVPKHRVNADGSLGPPNDVTLAGVFHKMGYRGTISTQLSFGERGECRGSWWASPTRGSPTCFT
jgi:butyryl-CoA dehydrogenase